MHAAKKYLPTEPTDDIVIEGAENITFALTGRRDVSAVRRTYHLLERGHLKGAFKLGATWAIWRSDLLRLGRSPQAAE